MTDLPMLADGCGDHDRLRVRMAVTGESLAQARRALACYPAPTAAEIDAVDYTRTIRSSSVCSPATSRPACVAIGGTRG